MRLKRLDLKAFGPFTDRTLDFNSDEPGLHIVFGRNEAGKSSSLRALKALLYGFHQQTPDNFIHNYDQLLVGGCLVNGDGNELIIQRRKKRLGDVLDQAGNPLDAGVLTPFLHGVEPEIFASLYGIDHDSLVRGGEEILAQKGEVGQALFAAGAGISSLREVILQLDREAAELFKATGQIPEINKALQRYKILQGESRKASLSAKEWKDLRKLQESALAERAGLENERERKNKEAQRLERLTRAIPELAALQNRRDRLAALGDVVLLDPGFAERYLRIGQEIREAQQQLQRDRERLGKLLERQRTISYNRELLSQAERIDDFHQRLGEYRKGQKDKPERNGMRIALRSEAASLLQRVRPDLDLGRVETLRPLLAGKRTVQALAARHEAIRQKLEQARKQGKAAEQEQAAVAKGLAAIPAVKDPQNLLQVVKPAQKAGDIDAMLVKSRSDNDQGNRQCLAELQRIGLWVGELPGLMELPLPLPATLRRFEADYSELVELRRELEKEHRNNDRELKNAEAERKKLEYAGRVPSEEELRKSRAKREQGWQLVRRNWLDHEDVGEESRHYDPQLPLAEAYAGYVEQSDGLADRLRREADRVAGAAALQARTESLQESLAANAREIEAVLVRAKDLHAAWLRVWQPAGIAPLSPKEMIGWLAEIDKLRFKIGDIVKKEQELGRVGQRRKELRQAMEKELCLLGEVEIPAGEALGPVLVLAEMVLEKIAAGKAEFDKLLERREQTALSVRQAGEDLKNAEEALAEWREQWQKAIAGLGDSDAISPLDAVDRLDILQSCFDKLKEADVLQRRIDGIDRDAADFDREVKALLTEVAPELAALPLDQTILQLRTMLGQAQKDGALFTELAGEIHALQDEIAVAGKILQASRQQMEELLKTARCTRPEELPAVIDRFAAYAKLREQIADTEAGLAKIGAGVGPVELARQAAEVNFDDLAGMTALLAHDIEERINPEINRISQQIGEINGQLAAMDGGARAADLTGQMEQELARIRRLAERYAVVKLSARVLQREIERYREEHQDPVLKLGSRYFCELTLGSFTGLRTDVDDKGEPVLVGVRQGDVRLTVDKMSSGTRDQLFLALRLATLEWRLERNEPMPFIVDDILINFDDDRSKATLTVLADLARKNQVILFTHHRRIVDEAMRIDGHGGIQIHEL